MKLADCPVFPAEAGTALSTDRGWGCAWREKPARCCDTQGETGCLRTRCLSSDGRRC